MNQDHPTGKLVLGHQRVGAQKRIMQAHGICTWRASHLTLPSPPMMEQSNTKCSQQRTGRRGIRPVISEIGLELTIWRSFDVMKSITRDAIRTVRRLKGTSGYGESFESEASHRISRKSSA